MPSVRVAAGSGPPVKRCRIWTLMATAAGLLLAAHQPPSLWAQQPSVDSKLLAEAKHQKLQLTEASEHPSINLIRVDQPVQSTANTKTSDQPVDSSLNGFEGAYLRHTAQQELVDSSVAIQQPEVQQPDVASYLVEERNSELAKDAERALEEHQVERRFGLFKKGGGGGGNQYGAPLMSSQYTQQASYLSDCDRCFASLNQQQQQPLSGDLIQQQPLEPPQVSPGPISVPVPVPIPVPIAAPQQQLPIHSYQHPHQSSYGGGVPLKSKFFNKFPFFMKGGSGAGFGNQYMSEYDAVPYWPTQTTPYHQPQHQRPTSGALYLRPAAYNCVQAPLPSQFLAPITQEMAFKGSSSGGGSSSSSSGTKGSQLKQYQQQQPTYSSY